MKMRIIDDFHESMLNDACSVHRRIRMGRIADLLLALAVLHLAWPSEPLVIGKSDFRGAYRNCPIFPGHLEFAGLAFLDILGNPWRAHQWAMPFGAVSSVYAWDRLGAAMAQIIRSVLHLGTSRYVDDLFWPDFETIALETSHMVVRLMWLCGLILDVEKTPDPASPMDILGVSIELSIIKGMLHALASVDGSKACFWLREIQGILSSSTLDHEVITKLVGRLSFAAFAAYGPSSRSRLTSLYHLLHEEPSRLTSSASSDLHWWASQLRGGRSRAHRLGPPLAPPVFIYTDAEGTGGIGAVLWAADISPFYIQDTIPENIRSRLLPRKTQINAFEVIAVWATIRRIGLLRNRDVILFIDNTVALQCIRKGDSRVADISSFVQDIWDISDSEGIGLFPFWVPSKLNVADPPSRGVAPVIGTRQYVGRLWS